MTRTTKTEKTADESLKPANIQQDTPSSEPTPPKPAAEKSAVEAEVNAKLKRTPDDDGRNPFDHTNPAALEKAAEALAKQQGFELNRGTAIGARLMARRGKLL